MANIIWSVFHLFYSWPTLFNRFFLYFTHSIGFSYILLMANIIWSVFIYYTHSIGFSYILLMANFIRSVIHIFYSWPTFTKRIFIYFTHGHHYSIGFSYILLMANTINRFFIYYTHTIGFSYILLMANIY